LVLLAGEDGLATSEVVLLEVLGIGSDGDVEEGIAHTDESALVSAFKLEVRLVGGELGAGDLQNDSSRVLTSANALLERGALDKVGHEATAEGITSAVKVDNLLRSELLDIISLQKQMNEQRKMK